MRHLSHKKDRFLSVSDSYSSLFNYSNPKEQLLTSSAVMNFIWNNWNNFWRDFWLAYVSGGYDLRDNKIIPIHPHFNDKQSCNYLLILCGKKKLGTLGNSINGNYQELTWGDPHVISDIASKLPTYQTDMNQLLGFLGHYQRDIEHFQRIRNCFIHLNNENVYNLSRITNYYSFAPNQRLIDILETRSIMSNMRCFDALIESLKGMLINLA